MDELEDLKKENQDLKEEIEKIRSFNESLIRQVKERANASKGQYPKKRHSGYSLVSSVQKEYRYYKNGNHKTAWIFETVFQTPYDIGFKHEDVLDTVHDDLYGRNDDDKTIIEILGFSDYLDYKTYPEVYEGDVYRDMKSNLIDQYKKQYDTYYVPDDVLDRIRGYSENIIKNCCFNLNIRMNGKAGYWEMSINHAEPLKNLPQEFRFPTKMKKKKNDNSKEKEDK